MSNVKVKYAVGKAGRMVLGRLLPGTDLVEGVTQICEETGIKSGALVCAHGSLRKATFTSATRSNDYKAGIGYMEPIEVEGPIEFIMGQGTITEAPDGNVFVHFHAMFCNEKLNYFGGHFNPGGNPVWTTVDIAIIETEGVEATRKYDDETGYTLMDPAPTKK